MTNLIFIGGCPRSGTTLIKRILGAHSGIYCGPEFGHLPGICDLYVKMKRGIDNGRLSSYASKDGLKNIFGDFVLGFFLLSNESHQIPTIAEKTPENVRCFTTLHDIFPHAKFVHVIRNPLDVVSSYLRVGKRMAINASNGNRDLSSIQDQFKIPRVAAEVWKRFVYYPKRNHDVYSSQNFQSNYLEVKYEDIVVDPEVNVAHLCSFLNISFEKKMLDTDRSLPGDATKFGGEFYTKDEYVSPINLNSISSWKSALSVRDIVDIIDVTETDLKAYGYMSEEEINQYKSSR